MSVRQDRPTTAHNGIPGAMEIEAAAAGANEHLGEGNSFAVAAPENPLKRNIVVSIKASLNDLCLQKARGTWAPSQESLRSICKPRHSNHLGTVGLRPTVGEADLARASVSQSSSASSPAWMVSASRWVVSRAAMAPPPAPCPPPRPARLDPCIQVADGLPPCATVGRPQVGRAARHEDYPRQVQLPRRPRCAAATRPGSERRARVPQD